VRRRILHLVDTLDAGGTERVAVLLANRLPRDAFEPFLGTTRRDGPLAATVAPDVARLRLERRFRLDPRGPLRLARALRRERIDLVHAHSTTLFVAVLARPLGRWRRGRPALLWHDHYGEGHRRERPTWLYGAPVRGADGVVAAEAGLAAWARGRLGVAGDRVWHLPNGIDVDVSATPAAAGLPGAPGYRLVCVANLRRQKDHETLLAAMARVAALEPRAHLLLVGSSPDPARRPALEATAARLGVAARVTFLGPREDVPAVLRGCDVGVLSSRSEGTPLALLEYGAAGLAAVATDVGGCGEVLDRGGCGRLVAAGDPAALADAVVGLLGAPAARAALGAALASRIRARYSTAVVLPRLAAIYDTLLADGGDAGSGAGS
jgi:glycosyltransferase involved in cell wall biosynthesis